jgi:hypothetical protein
MELMDYVFDLLDKDGERSINGEEYTLFLIAYRLDNSSFQEVFNKLDVIEDGHLSNNFFNN